MGISYDYSDPFDKFGKNIHKITRGDEYTHALLSFDTDLEHIIQFQMHGIERGNINTYEAVKHTKSIYVCVQFLTKNEINQIKEVIKEYENSKSRYDALNFVSMFMGKSSRSDKRHVCSTFVGYLLNVANKKNMTKDYSEFRPGDITILPRSFFVMTFKDFDDFQNKKEEFKKRVQQIYDDNIEDIKEYNNEIPRVMLDSNLKKSGNIRDFFSKLMFGD